MTYACRFHAMHASETQIPLSILSSIERFDEFKLIFRSIFALVFSDYRPQSCAQIITTRRVVPASETQPSRTSPSSPTHVLAPIFTSKDKILDDGSNHNSEIGDVGADFFNIMRISLPLAVPSPLRARIPSPVAVITCQEVSPV